LLRSDFKINEVSGPGAGDRRLHQERWASPGPAPGPYRRHRPPWPRSGRAM